MGGGDHLPELRGPQESQTKVGNSWDWWSSSVYHGEQPCGEHKCPDEVQKMETSSA